MIIKFNQSVIELKNVNKKIIVLNKLNLIFLVAFDNLIIKSNN